MFDTYTLKLSLLRQTKRKMREKGTVTDYFYIVVFDITELCALYCK